jgi:antitoxin (DNA-binding transcriptional repressor) of toxin-antitoxin stability system
VKVVEKKEATRPLADYASEIQDGPVVVTDGGQPVAALVPIENADLETVSLSTNRRFLDLIERSRSRVRDEGGVSSEEMRRRFD